MSYHGVQCKDIHQTISNISTHISELLNVQRHGAALKEVFRMENPVGAYTFRLVRVNQTEATVELIKKSLGSDYVAKWTDKTYGTVDIIILAEKYDQDTYSCATDLYSAFKKETAANKSRSNGDDNDESDDYDDYDDDNKHKGKKKNRRDGSFTKHVGLNVFMCAGVFLALLVWFFSGMIKAQLSSSSSPFEQD